MAERVTSVEELKYRLGVVVMFFDPIDRAILISSDKENHFKDGELVEGVSGGQYGTVRGYELPGGEVEEGESSLEALMREILEETGVDFSTTELIEFRKNPEILSVLQMRGEGDYRKYAVCLYKAHLSWKAVIQLEQSCEQMGKSLLFLSKEDIMRSDIRGYVRERDAAFLSRYYQNE